MKTCGVPALWIIEWRSVGGRKYQFYKTKLVFSQQDRTTGEPESGKETFVRTSYLWTSRSVIFVVWRWPETASGSSFGFTSRSHACSNIQCTGAPFFIQFRTPRDPVEGRGEAYLLLERRDAAQASSPPPLHFRIKITFHLLMRRTWHWLREVLLCSWLLKWHDLVLIRTCVSERNV